VNNFQGKILMFMESHVPLKKHFNLQHYLMRSRTCMNPENTKTFPMVLHQMSTKELDAWQDFHA